MDASEPIGYRFYMGRKRDGMFVRWEKEWARATGCFTASSFDPDPHHPHHHHDHLIKRRAGRAHAKALCCYMEV